MSTRVIAILALIFSVISCLFLLFIIFDGNTKFEFKSDISIGENTDITVIEADENIDPNIPDPIVLLTEKEFLSLRCITAYNYLNSLKIEHDIISERYTNSLKLWLEKNCVIKEKEREYWTMSNGIKIYVPKNSSDRQHSPYDVFHLFWEYENFLSEEEMDNKIQRSLDYYFPNRHK